MTPAAASADAPAPEEEALNTHTQHSFPPFLYFVDPPPLSPRDVEEIQGTSATEEEHNNNDNGRRIGWNEFFRFPTGTDEERLDRVLGLIPREKKKRKRKRKRKAQQEEQYVTTTGTSEDAGKQTASNKISTSAADDVHDRKRRRQEEEEAEAEMEVEEEEEDDIGDDEVEDDSEQEDFIPPSLANNNNHRRTWNDNFQLLLEYQNQKGDTWVPYRYKKDQHFAYWVHVQRKLFTQRKRHGIVDAITDERFMFLESIGFEEEREDTENKKETFQRRLTELKAFQREFKHTRVPKDYDDVPGLRKWVVKMRRLYKQGNQGPSADISQEEIDALDEIGFQWKVQGRSSSNKRKDENTAKPTKRKRENGADDDKHQKEKKKKKKKLGDTTTTTKRTTTSAKKVKGKKTSREQEIEVTWWARYKELKKYKKDNNGDANIPKNYEDQTLANWFNNERFKYTQRCRGDQDAFPEDRYNAFLKLGVPPNHMSFKQAMKYLEAFKKKYKHTRVPKGNMVAPQLRQWVVRTRKQYKEKQKGNASDLNKQEIDALNKIGFEWEVKKASTGETIDAAEARENTKSHETYTDNGTENSTEKNNQQLSGWQRRFQQLQQYKSVHGNTMVPQTYELDPKFASWVERQRDRFIKRQRGDEAAMSDKHFHAFKEIGFEGETRVSFKKRMKQLRAFREEYKHLNVPKDYDKIPGLGIWVWRIRERYRESPGDVPEKCLTQLNAIGFCWADDRSSEHVETHAEEKKSEHLDDHQNDNNHIEDRREPERISNNEESEDDDEDSFGTRLAQLQAFQHQFNSTRVPKDYDVIPGLYAWTRQLRRMYHQREQGKQTALTEEEIRALNNIDFDWQLTPKKRRSKQSLKTSWFARLDQLKAYKKAHGGSTAVPSTYDQDPLFGHWVRANRELFTRKKRGDEEALSDERFKALEELGFEEKSEDPIKVSFSKRISQLKAFRDEFHHMNVPLDYDVAPGLGKWVIKIRGNYKRRQQGDPDAISDDAIRKLNGIGFRWRDGGLAASTPGRVHHTPMSPQLDGVSPVSDAGKQELTWAGRFQQLKEYKEANNGSTKVPSVYQPDQTFSNWVRTQRRLFTKRVRGDKTALSDDRFQALKNLGFQASSIKVTSSITNNWDTRIQQLREYREKFGDIDVSPNNPYDEKFYGWVVTQRFEFDKKKRGEPSRLTDLRFAALQSLGLE